MFFKILFMPQHTHQPHMQEDMKWAESQKFDVIGATEQYGQDAMLHHTFTAPYRVFTGTRARTGSDEVPLIIRNAPLAAHHDLTLVSDNLDGTKLSHPRWLNVVRFSEGGRKRAFLNTHWDAVLQKGDGSIGWWKRVGNARSAAKAFQKTVRQLHKTEHVVYAMGDFNYYSVAKPILWYWSPKRMFARLGLDSYEHRIDYLAWSRGRVRVVGKVLHHPPGTRGNHGDHEFLSALFTDVSSDPIPR